MTYQSKIFVFTICCLFFYSKVYSQNIGQDIFRVVCNNLINSNDNYLINQNLKGISVLFDPVTNNYVLKKEDNLALSTRFELAKLTDERVVEICNDELLMIMPLSKKVIIVDTIGFFSNRTNYKNSRNYFEVQKSITSNGYYSMLLYAVGIHDNYLVISFLFKEHQKLVNFYIHYTNNKLQLKKRTIIDFKKNYE